MKKNRFEFPAVLFLILLALSPLALSGCAVFALGAGAAGGYAISQDEMEGFTDQNFERAWDVTRTILMESGNLTFEDKTHGILEADVRKSHVRAKIESISQRTHRIRIKARKWGQVFPDIHLAQELYSRVAADLK